MKYKVLKSLIYDGTSYVPGQDVDILEKSVAENCLERELIEEIKETEKEVDTAEEVVSTETSENEENSEENTKTNDEKLNKSGKNKKNLK